MGWYAQTAWDLSVNKAVLPGLAAELLKLGVADEVAGPDDTPATPVEVLEYTLAGFNEDSDFYFEDVSEHVVRVTGWGSGKAYAIGEDPDWRPAEWALGKRFNYGGLGVYAVLAKYVVGTVDWHDDDGDTYWRIRFRGDGYWGTYEGRITYPHDPGG